MRTFDYAEDKPVASGSASVRWNAIALVGRQGLILGFSVLLARILGPESIGIVAQASVFIALATLLLDQGLTASLISAGSFPASVAGAAMSVNLILGILLAAVTVVLSSAISVLLRTPELSLILPVLAIAFLLKALAVVPRMLLMRRLNFRPIAFSDTISALVSGVVAVILTIFGVGFWALVAQLILMDLICTVWLLVSAKPPLPNLKFRSLASHWRFGSQVFLGNSVAFTSRNIDNLLVARYFGAADLGLYSVAYRVLLTPVQMIGQVVTRVLFPSISRIRDNAAMVQVVVLRSVRCIAASAFPLMTVLAVSSYQWIEVFLGTDWLAAAPVLIVLALTGARQAVTSVNAPILLGMNKPNVHLKFNLLAGGVQIIGIVAGLPWGILGVAIGYTISGFLLTPAILILQKRIAGIRYSLYGRAVAAPLHGCVWMILVYFALLSTPLSPIWTLCLGVPAALAAYIAALGLFHRHWLVATASELRTYRGGRELPSSAGFAPHDGGRSEGSK